MNATAVAQKKIRRALEIPIYNALVAASVLLPGLAEPAIDFGRGFNRTGMPSLRRYIRFGVIWGEVQATEIGPTPRIEANGTVEVSAFTLFEDGPDANDALLVTALSPYVYNAEFEFEGIRVTTWTTTPRQGAKDGTWWFQPTITQWTVLRT